MNGISMIIVIALALIVGCATTQTRIPTDAEINAALDVERKTREIKAEEDLARQAAINKQRADALESKIESILRSPATNIDNVNIEALFDTTSKAVEKGKYETRLDYIERMKSRSDSTQVHYFEIAPEFTYSPDNALLVLDIPRVDAGVIYPPIIFQQTELINPDLREIAQRHRLEEVFLWMPIRIGLTKSTYTGQNSFGAKTIVEKRQIESYGFAAYFNVFLGMKDYGRELIYKNSDTFPHIEVSMRPEEAEARQLNVGDLVVRVGLRYAYGIGPLAVDTVTHHDKPTINSPTEIVMSHKVLGVFLENICIMDKKNNEVLSCKLNI